MNTSSTSQQVAKMHTANENDIIILTPETFGWFKAGNTYEINTVNYECIEVVTKGKGNHTLYRMQNTTTGEVVEGDIADLKIFFNIDFVNNYKTSKNPFGKLYNYLKVTKCTELVAGCENAEVNAKYEQLVGLLGLLDRAEREKAEKAEKEQKERDKEQKETEKMVCKLREQGMPEEFIQMYLANRK